VTRRYLLDTNFLSAYVREPSGKARLAAMRFGNDLLCTSAVVAAELRFGAAQRRSVRLELMVETALGNIDVLPFDNEASKHYGTIRAALEKSGMPIGRNDYLIAAHAVSIGAALVTANEREFRRVQGLAVENWL
jgi:tRNA(fMet)-specific endonuclease VapC